MFCKYRILINVLSQQIKEGAKLENFKELGIQKDRGTQVGVKRTMP